MLAALDADGDGALAETELVLDTVAKQAAIATRLVALGLPNPRIVGDVQPYTINHDVTNGEWVTRECTACHGDDVAPGTALHPGRGRPDRRDAGPAVQR